MSWNLLLGVGLLMGAAPTDWSAAPNHAFPADGHPLGYTVRSWALKNYDPERFGAWMRYLHGLGYNNLSVDLAWGDVEKAPGQFDFSLYDDRLQHARDLGMTLQIKFNSRSVPEFRQRDDLWVRSPDGQVVPKGPFHTMADDDFTAALASFYEATAQHYRGWPVLFYCSAFAVSFESEYHHTVWTDWSPPAVRQFRAFLRERYPDPAALNAAWRTQYATWDDVAIAYQGERLENPHDPRFVDFLRFREWSATRFFDRLADAIHRGDPKAEYGPQVGRVFGTECLLRGTVSAFTWARRCDWLFVDPAPQDDYPWAMAIARASGKKVAVELDGVYAYKRDGLMPRLAEAYATQAAECYANGAAYVCIANWSDPELLELTDVPQRCAEAKRRPAASLKPTEAVFVSKWDEYLCQGRYPSSSASACLRFRELLDAGIQADMLTDDILERVPKGRYRRIHLAGGRVLEPGTYRILKDLGPQLVVDAAPTPLTDVAGRGWEAPANWTAIDQELKQLAGLPPKSLAAGLAATARVARKKGDFAAARSALRAAQRVARLPAGPPRLLLRGWAGVADGAPQPGNGVIFEVAVREGAEERSLWKKLVTARAWEPFEVDLTAFAGKSVALLLRTDANGSSAYDWAVWGEPEVVAYSGTTPPAESLRLYSLLHEPARGHIEIDGKEQPLGRGADFRPTPRACGGISRQAISAHPPHEGGIAGATVGEFTLAF